MFKRISIVLAILLVLTLASGAWLSASARGPIVPFKGYYITHPNIVGVDPNGCFIQQMTGEGDATHLGTSSWYSEARACLYDWTQQGWILFTADNGDLLLMSFSGTHSIGQDGAVSFQGRYTIDPDNDVSTGRFEGAGGTGIYWGTASLVPGSAGEIYFDGTLEKP